MGYENDRFVSKDELRRRIAELEAENETIHALVALQRARTVQAEAELAALKEQYQPAPVAALREELAALRWKLQFCIDHDVSYVKADPLMSVEEFLESRWAAREETP